MVKNVVDKVLMYSLLRLMSVDYPAFLGSWIKVRREKIKEDLKVRLSTFFLGEK